MSCYLQVIWKVLFSNSSRDHGTLGHFCSLLGRLPNAKVPRKDFNACLDALLTVLKGHFIAAACNDLGITNANEEPEGFAAVKHASVAVKKAYIDKVARNVVKNCSVIGDAILGKDVSHCNDHINNYARVFCHYGSLALEFHDAWSEGDGDRIVRCWGVFLLHFYKTRRTKYALEALRLKLQLASLPLPLAHQLQWNRFVNTHGGPGHNLPCDLHNEHVNKLLKEIITNMGANLKEEALTRAARSVTLLRVIRDAFDKQSCVPVGGSAHSTHSAEQDIQKVVSVLLSKNVFGVQPKRSHSSFRNISANPLQGLHWENMATWITQKKTQYMRSGVTRRDEDEENDNDSDESDD